MKQIIYAIALIAILFSCNAERIYSEKELRVLNLIEYTNKNDVKKADSITSKDFQLITDSLTLNKEEFLRNVTLKQANRTIQLIKIETVGDIVKTKEKVVDDFITYLNLKPFERTREHHFNESNLIKSIYVTEYSDSPEYFNSQRKFIIWANKEYPDLFKKMVVKTQNRENIDEERRFLLTKLKNKGINVLNDITLPKTEEINHNSHFENKYITPPESFLKSVLLTYYGQNAFPYGENSVNKFIKALASTSMSNGKNPIIKGWTKENNEYTLHVSYDMEEIKFVFTHLLNQGGQWSEMYGMRNGDRVAGIYMYQLVPSLIQ